MASDTSEIISRLAVGERLPAWSVTAINDAANGRNPIHDDAAAQRHGFAGGLVAGVTTYGYLLHPMVALLGQEFLRNGASQVRLRSPIYAGQRLDVVATVSAVSSAALGLELEVRNDSGAVCAVGAAQWPAPAPVARPQPRTATLPETLRPATPEALRAEPVLGTLSVARTRDEVAGFNADAADELDCYSGLVHPAWLLRQANILLDRSVALGPWIHTASDIQHLGIVRPDEAITVRGEVIGLSQRKGHDYADIDIVIETTQPVMRILHTAIYRLAESGQR
ncbi:MAG: MaoC family dehydratase [Proteobacteria bacterium]|nr:MaoC family dehydratase [Pseudomonadota bacterium]